MGPGAFTFFRLLHHPVGVCFPQLPLPTSVLAYTSLVNHDCRCMVTFMGLPLRQFVRS
jgi:hypothetical protein